MKKEFLLLILTLVFFFNAHARDYYLSSTNGNNLNDGLSAETAWESFEKINGTKLQPGDQILFRAEDVFTGQLKIEVQGEPGKPIVISKYGDGKNPLLDGDGAESAVFLRNPAHIIIENLEIKNWKGVYGIRFEAEDAGEMKNFTLQNLFIHDVGAEMFETTNPSKTKGAIVGRAYRGTKPSWWNGLTIENVDIKNVGSCGITFGSRVNLYKLEKDDPYYVTNKNVVIENCRIDSTARDGIWIRQCEGAVIQNCVVSHTGLNAISNGIWFWDCLDCVMQYNEGFECLSPRGNDGAPFSIDNHCWNCTIQYNYSHDNEGPGYMLFGRMGDNGGNVVRNNLSYNDNVIRTYKYGTACITACSEVKNATVENNIIVAGDETHNILGHRNWEGFPLSVTYKNNLFIGNGKAVISELEAVLDAGTFKDNFFVNIPNLPEELWNKNFPATFPAGFENFMERISEEMNSKR